MKKTLFFVYALLCYLLFFSTFLYLIGFVGNLYVPKSIDTGERSSVLPAILIDLGLVALFGLQHSIMARQGFKEKWTRFVPQPLERSTYVLFATIVLIVLLFFWKPLPGAIWDLSGTGAGTALQVISFLGWAMVLLSTFLINHFHLFGLMQVVRNDEQEISFRTPFLYKMVRHPLYLGFLIAFWAAPVMTIGHLVFAAAMTVYILIGIHHEEKDLIKNYGDDYRRYSKKTPGLFPLGRRG